MGFPKDLHVPSTGDSAFWEMGEGAASHLPRDGAQPRTLPCRPGFREALTYRERGHLPGRAVPLPRGDILPSTLKSAQKEIWSTKVNTKLHKPQTGLPALCCPLTRSQGEHKNVTLSIPQGSFLLAFLSSNSILHSDWPTITSLFPHLLENHICPLPPSFPNSSTPE